MSGQAAGRHFVRGGDHAILVGEVLRTRHAAEGEPLLYFRGEYRSIGDRPEPAHRLA